MLAERFRQQGWDSEPWREAARLARSNPLALAEDLRSLVRDPPAQPLGMLPECLLGLLPEEAWAGLLRDAVRAFRAEPGNQAAEAVLREGSQQVPHLLRPHLKALFRTDAWFERNCAAWAWRAAGPAHRQWLKAQLTGPNHSGEPTERLSPALADTRVRAFAALLETRRLEAVQAAWEAAPGLPLGEVGREGWLEEVGLEWRPGRFRRLHPRRPLHLVFAPGHLLAAPPHLLRELQPTWGQGQPASRPLRLGGESEARCGVCGGQAHHLLTLAPIPEGLGVTGLGRLELVTCLSCLGWSAEVLWFRHDGQGHPTPFAVKAQKQPQFPVGPLRETQVTLADFGPRWTWQDWDPPGNLYRLGGPPSWVQSAQYPRCPGCRRRCTFLLQLDSGLPTRDKDEWLWGSGGMGYLFWCNRCRVSGQRWQCT